MSDTALGCLIVIVIGVLLVGGVWIGLKLPQPPKPTVTQHQTKDPDLVWECIDGKRIYVYSQRSVSATEQACTS